MTLSMPGQPFGRAERRAGSIAGQAALQELQGGVERLPEVHVEQRLQARMMWSQHVEDGQQDEGHDGRYGERAQAAKTA